MIPETEYSQKLDTETIYSYLNQFQDKFVHDAYKSLDDVQTQSKISTYIQTVLKGLVESDSTTLHKSINNDFVYYAKLPEDFGLYLVSSTDVSETYQYKTSTEDLSNGIVTNTIVPHHLWVQLTNSPLDSMRIIRNPIIQIRSNNDGHYIDLLCDRYTTPLKVNITYYKVPKYMDLMTSTPCELSMDVFDDLVSGAVDLYVQYVAGAEARKRQLIEQQTGNNKDNKDERS